MKGPVGNDGAFFHILNGGLHWCGGQIVMVIPKLDMVVTILGANYQDAATFVPQRVYVPRYILPAVSRPR